MRCFNSWLAAPLPRQSNHFTKFFCALVYDLTINLNTYFEFQNYDFCLSFVWTSRVIEVTRFRLDVVELLKTCACVQCTHVDLWRHHRTPFADSLRVTLSLVSKTDYRFLLNNFVHLARTIPVILKSLAFTNLYSGSLLCRRMYTLQFLTRHICCTLFLYSNFRAIVKYPTEIYNSLLQISCERYVKKINISVLLSRTEKVVYLTLWKSLQYWLLLKIHVTDCHGGKNLSRGKSWWNTLRHYAQSNEFRRYQAAVITHLKCFRTSYTIHELFVVVAIPWPDWA